MSAETLATPKSDFPFEAHYLDTPAGRLHYVDEGAGPAIVMAHGTPTWSYLYRHLIAALANGHRVIAVDHLGFGRSDKPPDADYRPAAHAQNLELLIDSLGLESVVLVVHDFGGPIGLSYAIEHPDRVRGIVLFNTWMWSLEGTPAERLSRFMSGRIGRFLYTRLNFSPRVILKVAYGDRSRLTREIHRRYLEPFPSARERMAPWVFARELIGSSEWYAELWDRRDRIAEVPALLLWGMKDPAFSPDDLARWKTTLRNAHVVEFPEAGHFVQEEEPERAAAEVRAFLERLEE